MGKYQIGDTVKIRTDLKAGKRYGSDTFTFSMLEMLGKTTTIKNILYNGNYEIKGNSWSWTDEMFENVNNEIKSIPDRLVIKTDFNYEDMLEQIKSIPIMSWSEQPTVSFINKGENKMKILDIYRENKVKEIVKECDTAIELAKSEDANSKELDKAYKIFEKIGKNLEKEYGKKDKEYYISVCKYHEIFTKETEDKINEIRDLKKSKLEVLDNLIEEVNARLELCDDKEENKIKVLRDYEIIDVDGKVNK
jgi:hypothetical protein